LTAADVAGKHSKSHHHRLTDAFTLGPFEPADSISGNDYNGPGSKLSSTLLVLYFLAYV
jgi:hypothetical protein